MLLTPLSSSDIYCGPIDIRTVQWFTPPALDERKLHTRMARPCLSNSHSSPITRLDAAGPGMGLFMNVMCALQHLAMNRVAFTSTAHPATTTACTRTRVIPCIMVITREKSDASATITTGSQFHFNVFQMKRDGVCLCGGGCVVVNGQITSHDDVSVHHFTVVRGSHDIHGMDDNRARSSWSCSRTDRQASSRRAEPHTPHGTCMCSWSA